MRISKEKMEKICEQILSFLFSTNPRLVFTSDIAREIARDEEFTKKLLIGLDKDGLVNEVKKSPAGVTYSRRSRWRMSEKAFKVYSSRQETS